MDRYYEDQYRYDERHHVLDLANSLHGYWGLPEVTSREIPSECYTVLGLSRDAASAAKYDIVTIKEKLNQLYDELTRFDAQVDEVTDEIYRSAEVTADSLGSIVETVGNLADLLNGVTTANFEDIDQGRVRDIFKPLHEANDNYVRYFAKVLLENHTLSDEEKDFFRNLLHGKGVTNITDEDLSGFSCAYNTLLKDHDEEWILNRIDMIFASGYLNDIYYTRNASSSQSMCLKYLGEFVSDENIEKNRYMTLVHNLKGKNGLFDQTILSLYRDALSDKGVGFKSNQDIESYLLIVDRMREFGIANGQIYKKLNDMYSGINLSNVYQAHLHAGSYANVPIDEYIDRFCKEEIFGTKRTPQIQKYMDLFYSRTTPEERIRINNIIYQYNTDSSVSVQQKIDFMIDFSMLFLGYVSDGTVASFYGDYYDKNGTGWCSLFVTWMLEKAGFLNDDLVEGITPENAIPDYCFAGPDFVREKCGPDRYHNVGTGYTPVKGDLVLFREYHEDHLNRYHIGIVIGMDEDKLYTIEGNTCGPIEGHDYSDFGEGENFNDDVEVPSDGKHGVRIKTYAKDCDRVGAFISMGGSERAVELTEEQKKFITANFDLRDNLVGCSKGKDEFDYFGENWETPSYYRT
ncbi:MAG: CHAP domain-containing protein [Clostridiales bacterium]|nr:CHAP domain-containing protein [Clostridiales bacterium]